MGDPRPVAGDEPRLRSVRLASPADDRLGPWLDLYQAAFPLSAQVPVSAVLKALRPRNGEDILLAFVEGSEERFVGMAWVALRRDLRAAALWYLAVAEPDRGRGLGTLAYREVVSCATQLMPDVRAVVLEVERPDQARDEPGRRLAERRIAFYRRLGARLCSQPAYTLDVGWQPPVRMHLMLHPLRDADEPEWLHIVRSVFGHGLEPAHRLVLE